MGDANHSKQDTDSSSKKTQCTQGESTVSGEDKQMKSILYNGTEMTKVFVLLLQPETKTFELIQLVYPTKNTTIGDILRMIPQHATELALGSQKYTGLCRPKDDHDLSDLTVLASVPSNATGDSSPAETNEKNACIFSGEILVAIPKGFTVAEVSKFSQAILTNRRFTKLLRRSNLVSSKSSRNKHGDHNKDRKKSLSSRKHRSRDAVHILEKHDEAVEEADILIGTATGHGSAQDQENLMQRAMQKAASAAAQANASISPGSLSTPSTSPYKSPARHSRHTHNYSPGSLDRHLQATSPNRQFQSPNFEQQSQALDNDSVASDLGTSHRSLSSALTNTSWVNGGASVYSTSTGDSLGDSLSSWSQSCGASLTGGTQRQARYARHRNRRMFGADGNGSTNLMQPPQPSIRRQKASRKSNRRLFLAVVGAILVVAYLLGCYFFDPTKESTQHVETVRNNPMGLPGLAQVVILVLILKKLQFLSDRRKRKAKGMVAPRPRSKSSCPAVRVYAKVFGGR